jgi:hypothetical protein
MRFADHTFGPIVVGSLVLVGALLSACTDDDRSSSGIDGGQSTMSASSGQAAGSGGSGGSTTSGAGGTAQPGETPHFTTPEELCAYVNDTRTAFADHARWRGLPFKGTSHNIKFWPLTFSADEALSVEAQAEADALAGGAGQKGTSHTDGMLGGELLHQYLYIHAVDTASYMISSQQRAGDWTPGSFKAGFIDSNATARQALYTHDTGSAPYGPKLTKIGCGGAFSPADGSTWWVIRLAP